MVRGLEYGTSWITVDGARVHLSRFGGDEDFRANLRNMTKAGDMSTRGRTSDSAQGGSARHPAAFLERSDAINPLRLQPFIRSSNDTLDTIGHPHLDTFTLTGPFDPTGPGDTPSRRKIFTCRPARDGRSVRAPDRLDAGAARLSRRQRRRPRAPARFLSGGTEAGRFDTGIQTALQRILASPKFSFRVERDPAGTAPGRLSHRRPRLASRLSFFLWSTIPDDQLLRVAGGALCTRRPC